MQRCQNVCRVIRQRNVSGDEAPTLRVIRQWEQTRETLHQQTFSIVAPIRLPVIEYDMLYIRLGLLLFE